MKAILHPFALLCWLWLATLGWCDEVAHDVRRPVALTACGDYVLVAHQRSGAISLIHGASKKQIGEFPCGTTLSDLKAISPTHALALDRDSDQVLIVELAERETDGNAEAMPQVRVKPLLKVGDSPVRLVVASTQRLACVASLWSKTLTFLSWTNGDARDATIDRTIHLDFFPREMLLLERQGKLLVADAFAGNLAVVDLRSGLTSSISLSAHNIRGLALVRPTLTSGGAAQEERGDIVVSHQTLDRGWIDRDGVHWGIVMANSIRGIPVTKLSARDTSSLDKIGKELSHWAEDVGLVGEAAGDPGAVSVDGQGRMSVALSGIHEVLITGASYRKQIRVGRRPVALLDRGDELWVVNQMDDTISVVDKIQGAVAHTIHLGPPSILSAADRGEQLFYDAKLSHDGWMSCHSCHTDGHTTGLLADTLGDGGYGAPKRIPSLLGVAHTGPWAWNGEMNSLPAQVKKSVETTMHGRPLSDRQTRDLVAFLQTLQTHAPSGARRGLHSADQVAAESAILRMGKTVFHREGCTDCHAPPHYTSAAAYDVGVVDAAGNRKFNPPSLRGVGHRTRLFHDGSRPGVKALIDAGDHQLRLPLNARDADALVKFLQSL